MCFIGAYVCGGQRRFSVFLPEENVLCNMMLEFMDMGEKLEQKTSQTVGGPQVASVP